jgi:periplasmic copper chaperone A
MRLVLALLLVLLVPAVASAHVTVLPESSRPGQTADLTFRVPNERDDAATVQVDVFLPKGVPAKVSSPEGWTQVVLPTGEVRWTAGEGTAINPGRTEDFKVRLGPLPNAPEIVFKALQHYADGQVVRWIQAPTEDAERPAAVLDLGGGGVIGTDATVNDKTGGAPWALIVAGAILLLIVGLFVALRRVRL